MQNPSMFECYASLTTGSSGYSMCHNKSLMFSFITVVSHLGAVCVPTDITLKRNFLVAVTLG